MAKVRTDRDLISEPAVESDNADGGGEIAGVTVVTYSSSPNGCLFKTLPSRPLKRRQEIEFENCTEIGMWFCAKLKAASRSSVLYGGG